MKNTPLETYRQKLGLTYRELTKRCSGLSLFAVHSHCKGTKKVSPESAMIYEESLGIPKEIFRPDLWPPDKEAHAKT